MSPAGTVEILHEGHFKMRSRRGGPWLAVLVRIEHSCDDEGRQADRPRLALYVGAERHERPDPTEWWDKLWPIGEAEYHRIAGCHTVETVDPAFDLRTAPSLF